MPHKHKPETVRLTIDFPANQHKYIKILAAKEGVTLRQFVLEHLPGSEKSRKKHKDIENDNFDGLLKDFLVEEAPMLKRLAKK